MADKQLEDLLTDSEDELPTGWEQRVTEAGRVFYVDHGTQHTQWQHPKSGKEKSLPQGLPFGWEKGTDEHGETIFIDHVNNKTTCVDPRIAYAMTDKKKAMVKFNADSTAMAVLRGRDLRGKTALITGANCGIGYETALALSLNGCHVILACQNIEKGNAAAAEILKQQKIPIAVDAVQCDLSSLSSVKTCAEEIITKQWSLDILICNAAVLGIPYQLSVDNIEMTFATNHLGHFYLVDLLKEVLIQSVPSRVVVVSSESHRFPSLYGKLEIQQLPIKKCDYWPMLAYNQSKFCNILFAFELNRRLSPYGVFCNAVHPGNLVSTQLKRHSYLYQAFYLLCRPFAKSQAQAAATTIYCATAPEMENIGGYYFNNCCECTPSHCANDEQMAKELWNLSEKLAYKKIDTEGRILISSS